MEEITAEIRSPRLFDLQEFSAGVRELVEPVSAASPFGADPRYLPEFGFIKAEIEKSSGADYGRILSGGRKLLKESAKDLRVLGYCLLGAAREEGLSSLCDGIIAYSHLVRQCWESVHPQRESARLNAVKWLNQERVLALLAMSRKENTDLGMAAEARQALIAMREFLESRYGSGAPSLGGLQKLFAGWLHGSPPPKGSSERSSLQHPQIQSSENPHQKNLSPASVPSLSETSGPATPPPVPQPENPPQSGAFPEDVSGVRLQLQKAAQYFFKTAPASPVSYKIMRILKWQDIRQAPAAPGGILKIPGPSARQQSWFSELFQDRNWKEIAAKAEEVFTRPGLHFWFDLQFYLVMALKGLGEHYIECAEVVTNELLCLLRRAPSLPELKFQDGTPFASARVRSWLQAEMEGRTNPLPGSDMAAALKALDVLKHNAVKLASEGNVDEALVLLNSGSGCLDIKDASERMLAMAELCLDHGRTASAEGLHDRVVYLLSTETAERWDRDFSRRAFCFGEKLFRFLAESGGASAEEAALYSAQAKECLHRQIRLDPLGACNARSSSHSGSPVNQYVDKQISK